jgi:hypothetical protein
MPRKYPVLVMNTFIIAENLNTDSAKKGGTMRVLKET